MFTRLEDFGAVLILAAMAFIVFSFYSQRDSDEAACRAYLAGKTPPAQIEKCKLFLPDRHKAKT
jgi:hypothetical protein